jgi:hypothetical protein
VGREHRSEEAAQGRSHPMVDVMRALAWFSLAALALTGLRILAAVPRVRKARYERRRRAGLRRAYELEQEAELKVYRVLGV